MDGNPPLNPLEYGDTFRDALEVLIDRYITEQGDSAQSIIDALQNAETDMHEFMRFDTTAVTGGDD